MRDTTITAMSSSYVEQINNYKTNIENILSSNTSVTSSLDVTAKAEKELHEMLKYHDRLELMQNYFLVTGSSE